MTGPYRESSLPRRIAIAYTLLVIYASLHPFSGWRDLGVPPFAYLDAAWPRYYTGFDLASNVVGYLPLGFLWAATFQARLPRAVALVLTLCLGMLLSLGMETIQNYLPSRVSSNVDLGCNTLGTLLGSIAGVIWGRALLSGGRLHQLRNTWIIPGRSGDTGLVLLALWLLTQLNPETLLLGSGDLRHLLGLEQAMNFDAEHFRRIETVVAGVNGLATGLVMSAVLRQRRPATILTLFFAALSIRALAYALLVSPAEAFHWITPGNELGLALGLALLLPCLWLPPVLRRVLAAMALLFATVVVNLAPENPYLKQATQVWRQGHFLNFNGLTRLASVLWPFLALCWLMLKEKTWQTSKP
ncbi:MAG: VanZ family protein [Proteobacteria bacterium]|nr:VanZ family protein [Pseudomonadota bacterium]HQR04473.1 VanZ family protein [Rhodocyclaceae bacterium]